MEKFHEEKVLNEVLNILLESGIALTNCKINISIGKSVVIKLTDHFMFTEKAFNKINKRWRNSYWKTRHNKKYVYKITIKA